MTLQSIAFDSVAAKVTVTLNDGSTHEYADEALYLADFPDRSGDFAAMLAPQIPIGIPQSVSALQGLLAVDQAGMAAAYTAWASDSSRTFAERAFIDKAQTWKRDDPTLMAAAAAFGLTELQIDNLFTLAASL